MEQSAGVGTELLSSQEPIDKQNAIAKKKLAVDQK
jgi:hypothetical protein